MKTKRYQPYGMAERIKQLISDSNMSCNQISEELGVERKTLYTYRDGIRMPDACVLAKMCKLFKVSSDYILFGDKK